MRHARLLLPATALAGLATAIGLLAASGPARSAPDCTPRTAWAGVESSALDGTLLEQWPATVPVRVTSVTVSWAYAPQDSAPPEFREALLLVGTADSPVAMDGEGLPPFAPSPDWAAPGWQTSPAGQPVNGNSQVTGNVLAARILKTAGTHSSASDSVTVPADVNLPAGGVLWVFAGTLPGFDIEAQTVATYQPAGC